jgi:3-oxoacyl-[acyl-carrier protein] reductase/meso-butanediol dehydrogenase/(S,S)-butanediol dehydrogenase/diacetyl reductase
MTALKDKIALITGAGGKKAVGRAIALKLAGLGASVVLTDLRLGPEDMHPDQVRTGWRGIESVAEEVHALGVRCLPVFSDLKDPRQIEDLVKQTVEHFGRIDILVNNARAIRGKDKVPITELSDEVWNYYFAINSKRAMPMEAAYASSKFALIGLTQGAALDLARYGITVNAVCPGNINTDRLSYWECAQADSKGMSLQEFRAGLVSRMVAETPLGRIAEPEDVANLVAFLASDDASFITGQAYNVNGGVLFH